MYKPLPEEVTIDKSCIDGLGLFSKKEIGEGHEFGITHVFDTRFENGFVRTPLGGFINHDENPNCKLVEVDKSIFPITKDDKCLKLVSIRNIEHGEEITTKYSLYSLKD